MENIKYIELDLNNYDMMMKLLPLYQSYEAEISKETVENIFPPDQFQENFKYFSEYFEDCTTYIYMADGEFMGFVSFHIDNDDTPGYADGYTGWGHMREIYVLEPFRGRGLAKIMAKKAEQELKTLGATGVYLGCVNILQARTFAADFCSFVVVSSLHTYGYAPRRLLEIAKNQARKSTHQSMSTRPNRYSR